MEPYARNGTERRLDPKFSRGYYWEGGIDSYFAVRRGQPVGALLNKRNPAAARYISVPRIQPVTVDIGGSTPGVHPYFQRCTIPDSVGMPPYLAASVRDASARLILNLA